MKSAKLIKPFRIDKPKQFRLADCDPADTRGLAIDKQEAKSMLGEDIERLAELQERLYAQGCWAVLAIFQAMDAGGKDSAIKHVMTGVNPQGCEVHAFGPPSTEELEHDFLWRSVVRLPRRGRIGIFNRSYYEEVLVVRVKRELVEREKLPPELIGSHIWKQRFEDICAFERHLVRNGTVVVKFHLRISKQEQRRRFLQRLEDPAKRWKFSMEDIADRKLWDRYMDAYEDMIRHTSTPDAPWYVVPADHKWFARIVVAAVMVEALDRLDLHFPKLSPAQLKEMQRIRKALEAEKD
jgi:PPK2 family polyphosphate:nucleotide phosphotransferase